VVVDLSELDSERLPLLKIVLRELHQFIQPFAEISVGERPSEASRVMCILSLRLGFISRFISEMRHSRSWGTIGIFSMCGRFFGGWMDGRLYHATKDGRLFSYPVHLSSFG
jgi:hypothetical protein